MEANLGNLKTLLLKIELSLHAGELTEAERDARELASEATALANHIASYDPQ